MADGELTPQQELAVLRKYALGGDLHVIARELDVSQGAVSALASVVGFQRGRAKELLLQREHALMGTRVNSRPVSGPPAPRPAPRATESVSVDKVLARAFEVGGKFAQKAERLRTMAVDLTNELAEMLEAERRVQELSDELARAKKRATELRKGAAVSVIRAPAAGGPESALARIWASDNNVECPERGQVPKAVLEAYRAAKAAA